MPKPAPQRRFIAYGLLAGSVLLLLMAVVLAQVLADAPAFLPWLRHPVATFRAAWPAS